MLRNGERSATAGHGMPGRNYSRCGGTREGLFEGMRLSSFAQQGLQKLVAELRFSRDNLSVQTVSVAPVNLLYRECEWMQRCGSAQGPSFERCGTVFCGLLFLLFSATLAHGQEVAEAARHAQAHKSTPETAPPHVYTEADLKRRKILTPEDQAKVEARKKQQAPALGEQNAQQMPDNTNPPTESLGELARRYRREKAAQAAALAEKKKFAPFPYTMPEGALAVPKLDPAPRMESSRRLNPNAGSAPADLVVPDSAPQEPNFHSRISPFQPRHSVAAPRSLPVPPPAAPKVPSAPRPTEPLAPPVASIPSRAVVPVVPRTSSRSTYLRKDASRELANPAPPAKPAELLRFEVRPGDSWWKLAEHYLGSGRRWQELRKLNAELVGPPESLRSGSIVLVPERVQKRERPSVQSISLKKGDSLWALAHEHLGRGSAWVCLAQANPEIVDYTHLKIGTLVQLPAGDALHSCRDERFSPPRN